MQEYVSDQAKSISGCGEAQRILTTKQSETGRWLLAGGRGQTAPCCAVTLCCQALAWLSSAKHALVLPSSLPSFPVHFWSQTDRAKECPELINLHQRGWDSNMPSEGASFVLPGSEMSLKEITWCNYRQDTSTRRHSLLEQKKFPHPCYEVRICSGFVGIDNGVNSYCER